MNTSSPTGNLCKLYYCSRILIAPGQLAGELNSILGIARAYNARAGITGWLTVRHDCFVQALEGPKATVDALIARITADPRHDRLLVFEREAIRTRRYGAWWMAFTLPGDPISDLAGVQVDAVFDSADQDEAHRLARIKACVGSVSSSRKR